LPVFTDFQQRTTWIDEKSRIFLCNSIDLQ
jgi:hypothetical protein